ncbi:hypothetical protein [Bosea sp. ANAM02]|uniref:hypothetical protein n=1 Tax=Bosea sp. ANAM02 TaxID=2020412 RepID=UPI0015668A53|nr:hypothetical protein [Bosea sp. ANAM02]
MEAAGFVAAFAAADLPFEAAGLAAVAFSAAFGAGAVGGASAAAVAEVALAAAVAGLAPAFLEAFFGAAGAATGATGSLEAELCAGSLLAVALTLDWPFEAFAAAFTGAVALLAAVAFGVAGALAGVEALAGVACFGSVAAAGLALAFALDAGLPLVEVFVAGALAASVGAAASQTASPADVPFSGAGASAFVASSLVFAAAGFEVFFRAAVAAAVLFEPAPFELAAGFFMFWSSNGVSQRNLFSSRFGVNAQGRKMLTFQLDRPGFKILRSLMKKPSYLQCS